MRGQFVLFFVMIFAYYVWCLRFSASYRVRCTHLCEGVPYGSFVVREGLHQSGRYTLAFRSNSAGQTSVTNLNITEVDSIIEMCTSLFVGVKQSKNGKGVFVSQPGSGQPTVYLRKRKVSVAGDACSPLHDQWH